MEKFLEVRVTEDSCIVNACCTGEELLSFLTEALNAVRESMISYATDILGASEEPDIVREAINELLDDTLEQSKSTNVEKDKENATNKLIEDIIRACL